MDENELDPHVERLISALETIGQSLDTDVMCPDPDAKRWEPRELQSLWRRVEDECVPALADVESKLPAEQLAGAKRGVAGFAVEIATLGGLMSDVRLERQAQELAERLASDELAADELVDEVRAAARDRNTYARLMHARWLHRRNDWTGGDRILRAIQTDDEVLAGLVEQALKSPRPLTGGAPSLGLRLDALRQPRRS